MVRRTRSIGRSRVFSLTFGERVFGEPDLLVLPTIREDDGEEHYKAIGLVDGKLYTAVQVWRG